MSDHEKTWNQPEPEEVDDELSDLVSETAQAAAEAENVTAELGAAMAEAGHPDRDLSSDAQQASEEEAEGIGMPSPDTHDSGQKQPPAEFEASERGAPDMQEVSSDDRLIGALAWASTVLLQLPIVPAVLLFAEANRSRRFQRYHSVTSLVFWGVALLYEVVAVLIYTIQTVISLGCLGLLLWVIFFAPHLVMLYYAYQAYNGNSPEIPFVSDFARKQRWL
jgi:uncharacterized membrane protein